MGAGKGFATIFGYKKASAWGTPVLLGAGNGAEFVSESLAPDAQLIPDEQISGKSTKLQGDKGNEFHSGDIVLDHKYEGIETLIALAMGTAGVPTQVGTDNAYKHVFKPAESREGLFATFAFGKQVAVWEYPTAKVGGFTLNCATGKRARLTFPIIPQGLNINTTGGVNKTSTISSVTLPTNRDFLLFKDMKISVAALGDALAEVYASEFEIAADPKFEKDDVTTKYGYLIDEPIGDGFVTHMGKLRFTKYNDNAGGNDALISALLTKVPKKMKIVWTGPVIGATAFSLTLWLPCVQFATGQANVGGPQRIPLDLNFEAARTLVLPSGFPAGYLDGLTMELVNQRATDALA